MIRIWFDFQLGCAVGFFLPPLIVPNDPDISVVTARLNYMFYGGAGFMTLLFFLVIICEYNSKPQFLIITHY